jgi:hypothetical protein
MIAVRQPRFRLKPRTRLAATIKTIPFSTNENRPNVMTVIGKARTPNTGRRTALSNPKTSPATSAGPIPSISIPVGSRDKMYRLSDVTNHIAKKLVKKDTACSLCAVLH